MWDGFHVHVSKPLQLQKTVLNDKPWFRGFPQALPSCCSWGSWKNSWGQTVEGIFNIYSNFRWRYYARQSYLRYHLLPLVTAPSLSSHGYLKCIARIHRINRKIISTKSYVEQGWLWRMHKECCGVDDCFCTKKTSVDNSTYVTSPWHVLHCIRFVLTGPVLAYLDGS